MGEVQTGCREELFPLTAWGQSDSDTLLRGAVQASSLEVYKMWLVEALSSLVWPQDWPLYEHKVGPDNSLGAFRTALCYDNFLKIMVMKKIPSAITLNLLELQEYLESCSSLWKVMFMFPAW